MTEENKRPGFFWPKIDDAASASTCVWRGTFCGGLFAINLFVRVVLTYTQYPYYVGIDGMSPEQVQAHATYLLCLGILVSFLTWRVNTGHGRFASVLLLVCFLFDFTMMLSVGLLGADLVTWIWGSIIVVLIHSVRASWVLHRLRSNGATTS